MHSYHPCVRAPLKLQNQKRDICYVHTPILTSSDCEGAGEAFRVTPSSCPPSDALDPSTPAETRSDEFFSKPAYLAVSSQLHLEALAAALARVYTLSPCFRAELWMLEAQWAWTREINDVCSPVEASVKDAIISGNNEQGERRVLAKAVSGYEERLRSLDDVARPEPWTRLPHTEAVAELEKYSASKVHPFQFEPKWGRSLQSEHERWLSEVLIKGPVFVTDY